MIYGAFQVWNPEYEPAGVLRHAEVLEQACKDNGPEPHVWWGKISRSKTPGEIERDHADNPGRELKFLVMTNHSETHFCTVQDIRWPRETGVATMPGKNVPKYYGQRELAVRYWFKIDGLCAIATNLTATLKELARFKDSRDKPINLYEQRRHEYGLPCLVQMDEDDYEELVAICRSHAPNFIEAVLGPDTNNSLIAVRTALDPDFSAFDEDIQIFLATGEQAYKTLRLDSSPAILSMFKAYEVIVTCSLAPAMKSRLGRDAALIPIHDQRGGVTTLEQYTMERGHRLGVKNIVAGILTDYVGSRTKGILTPVDHGWLFDTFRSFFMEIVKHVRNPAIHRERMSRGQAEGLYNATLRNKDTSMITKLHRLCSLMTRD
ncbi:MAG: hypothetical protein ABFD92_03825 [Planctomycetaceae bacterium]|nr:hypothetical protein [Planctomycetaceae bacterium]